MASQIVGKHEFAAPVRKTEGRKLQVPALHAAFQRIQGPKSQDLRHSREVQHGPVFPHEVSRDRRFDRKRAFLINRGSVRFDK
jgi:hypothetical protein